MSRKRNPNFSDMEVEILLSEIGKNKSVLFSKVSNSITNNSKRKIWESICEKVNSTNTSSHQRTVEELKKKWTKYASNAKKQASLNRRQALKTGGGPPPQDLTPLQDKVVGILGETPISGITGGTDTCSETTTSSAEDASVSFCLSGDSLNDSDSDVKSKKKVDDTSVLIEIERERLKVEKQLLTLNKERLEIEKQRLEIERQRLSIDQQKHQLYMTQLGVQFSHFSVENQQTTQNTSE